MTGRKRTWRMLGVLLAAVGASPALILAGGSVYLRHVPYDIPAHFQPDEELLTERSDGLSIQYLGVTGYEISDGETTLITDPAVTRPLLWELATGPIDSDPDLVARWIDRADYVLVNHAHFDHAIDAGAIAMATGATVVGTDNACSLARSKGVPEERLIRVRPPETLQLGTFTVQVRRTEHGPVLGRERPMSGVVDPEDDSRWFWEYRLDDNVFYGLFTADTSVWFHPAPTHQPGEFDGPFAPTIILGVAGVPWTLDRMRAVLGESGAQRIIMTHYDNFFHPIEAGMALLPVVDLERVRRHVETAAPGTPVIALDYGQKIWVPPDPSEDLETN